jgi:uncharacterized sulfatase
MADPDEVKNLADSKSHQRILKRLKKAQQKHAVEIRDVGFLPENEVHSRDYGSPPFTMGHDHLIYKMKPIMEMAEIASSLDPKAMKKLKKGFEATDSAIRYWAAMGVLMRGEAAVLEARDELVNQLADGDLAPRIAAAEALGRYGSDADATRALSELVAMAPVTKNGPYLSMMALNAIDSMGTRAKQAEAEIAAMPVNAAGVPGKFSAYIPNLLKSIHSNLNP